MQRLKSWREPAAYLVLAAIALQIVLALAAVGYYSLVAGPSGAGYIAAQLLSRTLLILAAIVVGSCALWGPPTPHARTVTLFGIVLFCAHGVLALVLAVLGMFESGSVFAMITVLLELLVPGLAVAMLVAVRSTLPTPVQRPPAGSVRQFPPEQRQNQARNAHSVQPGFQSQPDQFGNPYSNSSRRYFENPEPVRPEQSRPEQSRPQQSRPEQPGPDQWLPADQPGPQRLEPSPYQSPVGPHTRPDAPEDGVGRG